jgi:monofunctional glycosyltransferase
MALGARLLRAARFLVLPFGPRYTLFPGVPRLLIWLNVAITLLLLWFLPWVFSIHMGLNFYRPYEPDGTSRYWSMTGPWSPVVSSRTLAWTPWDKIPNACTKALVAAEDATFYEHTGVDWEATRKSLLVSKKRQRGGSTITQQLVKNLYLSRNRSYLRKAREIAGALLLNVLSSKNTQLLWYWNVVEFGPRTYGIGEAAHYYFRKRPEKLTSTECAQLVAILPSPIKWGKS